MKTEPITIHVEGELGPKLEARVREIAREEAQAVVAKTLTRLIDNAEREDLADRQ